MAAVLLICALLALFLWAEHRNAARMAREHDERVATTTRRLGVAAATLEAMAERRSYASAWEWKYGRAWDHEDAAVRALKDELHDELKELTDGRN